MPDEKTYLDKLLTRTPGFTYGDVLPFNQDEKGTTHLDLTAGIPGAAMQGWNTWSKLLQGKVAPYAIQDGPGDQSKAVINPDITQSAGALSMAAAAGSPLGTAPKGAARMFLGRNSSGADGMALRQAEKMAADGLSEERIWSQTGWFRGEDGHWRYEVSDHKAKINPEKITPSEPTTNPQSSTGTATDNTGTVSVPLFDKHNVAEYFKHQDLQRKAVYPEGTGTASIIDSTNLYPSYEPFVQGFFDPAKNAIGMAKASPKSFKGTMLHELQHAIQQKEGFVNGGSSSQFLPADFAAQQSAARAELTRSGKAAEAIYTQNGHAKGPDYKAAYAAFEEARQESVRLGQMRQDSIAQYHNILGEREARNVSKRSNMTNEERKQNPPWKTIDPYMKVN